MRATFWGVRGSVPSPISGVAVTAKIKNALAGYGEKLKTNPGLTPEEFLSELPFAARSTYGGNTSCVELETDIGRIVLDMGTGVRLLGNARFKEMLERNGLPITFLFSHEHWDHIQGAPFFGPLYVNKATGVRNCWTFYGGTNWQKDVEICLRGQMDPPTFPVSWKEIESITHKIETHSVQDMMRFEAGGAKVYVRKLNHPQETYGYRIEQDGKVFAFTTDNEPFDPLRPDPRLLELCDKADVWVTDCQYEKEVYEGTKGGVPRHNWGHSYPEAVAVTAKAGRVKKTILFHHDPNSNDEAISAMAAHCQSLLGPNQEVIAAYEGLVLNV